MMFNNKMVCCLKANGKVLREFQDTVYVPFGSEYSITLKNLSSVRAIVNVFIDSDNVVEGGLVINAGQEIDLQRSVRNNNLQEGNRFKFIERTGGIEEHRGIKLEDGLIRVEFQFERRNNTIQLDPTYWKTTEFNNTNTPFFNNYILRGLGDQPFGSTSMTNGASGSISASAAYDSAPIVAQAASMSARAPLASCSTEKKIVSTQSLANVRSLNDVGITVPGSKSDQKFSTASWFPTESEKHTMVFKLLGETADNKPVVAPVTVKAKPKCVTCGKVNKANAKFCSECGTALEIL